MIKESNQKLRQVKTSICIATFNGEKYIEKQLKSIINQTLKPNEIILYDDASTDNTIEIVKSVQRENKFKIKIIRGENNFGVIEAFSKAISYCNNELIFFSDQDDIWLDNKLEIITKIFSDDDQLEICFSNGYLINDKDSILKKDLFDYTKFFLNERIKFLNYSDRILIKRPNYVLGMSMAIRQKNLNKIFPINCENKVMTHDTWIILLSALCGWKIKYINNKLVKYRIHNEQTSSIYGKSLLNIKYKDRLLLLKKVIYSYSELYSRTNNLYKTKTKTNVDLLAKKLTFYNLRLDFLQNKSYNKLLDLKTYKLYFCFSRGFLSIIKDLSIGILHSKDHD